jgi:hypothetical protein
MIKVPLGPKGFDMGHMTVSHNFCYNIYAYSNAIQALVLNSCPFAILNC